MRKGGMLLVIAVGGDSSGSYEGTNDARAIAGIATWKAATHRLEKPAQSPRQE